MEVLEEKKIEIKPNEKQLECINAIDGKYLVIAGPGTGKTFTVTQRIKKMLEKGINPEKILCLTYSEAAAGEMKKKLAKAFDKIDIGVNIYTYHGFCNEIIGENAEEFELPNNYRIINTTISRQYIKECIEECQPVAYRSDKNDPYVYLKVISDKISEIKRFRYTKEQYEKNIQTNPDWLPYLNTLQSELEELKKNSPDKVKDIEKKLDAIKKQQLSIDKAREIWMFYEAYKSKMEKENYLDFDDMIGFVLDKFETSPSFLDEIANKYDYILVDEYQDTNKSQNAIVFNLVKANKNHNVFVVGDDDQIIYSFQGASLDTIEGFLTEFPDTKVICLTENMRSTQNILDVARVVAQQDTRRLEDNPNFKQYNIDKNLKSMNKDLDSKQNIKVRLTKYFNQEQEYLNIVDEIETLINSNDCPKDEKGEKNLAEIAVIMKGHDELAEIAELLRNRNIPIELKDGKSIFQIKSSIILYYYLQILVNPELNADKIYKLLLLPPFNINALDFVKLYERESMDISFIDSLRIIKDWKDSDTIKKFLDVYDYLRKFNAGEVVKNVVLEAGARTGIFDYFLNEEVDREENIAGLKKLVSVAKEFSETHSDITLEKFVEYLQTVENDREDDIKTDKSPLVANAIQLTTYHSSKGKEFEFVYMPSLQSSKWESSGGTLAPSIPVDLKDYKTKDEWSLYKKSDRNKTMYVGMTRAKHTLRLSYLQNAGKRATYPCQWVLAAQDLMEPKDLSDYKKEDFTQQSEKMLIKRCYDYKRDFDSMIKRELNDRYYSPTSINDYQACPRKYLYSDILNLDSPQGNADSLHYGTAVHDACEFMVKQALANGVYPSKEDYIKTFKEKLDTLSISSKEQRKILEGRGVDELSKFYHHMTNFSIGSIHSAEYKIRKEVDGVKFVGKIDRIDKNEDGTYTISDYKTGNPKTESKICMGGDYENYYKQICLYKYYFEKIEGETVSEVKFLFPLAPENPLKFSPSDEDCENVVQDFKQSVKDIEDCKFEPSYDVRACQYCQYREFCKMDVV